MPAPVLAAAALHAASTRTRRAVANEAAKAQRRRGPAFALVDLDFSDGHST
jgi:hypothetical protein